MRLEKEKSTSSRWRAKKRDVFLRRVTKEDLSHTKEEENQHLVVPQEEQQQQ